MKRIDDIKYVISMEETLRKLGFWKGDK